MLEDEAIPEAVADAPVAPGPAQDSAAISAPKPKKVIGRPITKENARQYQLSASTAKRLRKEARGRMLHALVRELNLGEELLKALKTKDQNYLDMIVKATRLIGVQHDQSPEALAQRIQVEASASVKKDSTVKLVLEDMTKPED